MFTRLLLLTKLACLLEAEELLLSVRDQRCARLSNDLQECIWCYGSPTGIPQRRSYDPSESLSAIHSARLLHSKAFALQEVYLLNVTDHGRAVGVGSVLRGQS